MIRFERKKKTVKSEVILNSHKIFKTCLWFSLKNCPTNTISFNKITPQICNNLISFIKTLSLLACGVDNFFKQAVKIKTKIGNSLIYCC